MRFARRQRPYCIQFYHRPANAEGKVEVIGSSKLIIEADTSHGRCLSMNLVCRLGFIRSHYAIDEHVDVNDRSNHNVDSDDEQRKVN